MSFDQTLPFPERLFKRLIADPKNFPNRNYFIRESSLARLARQTKGILLGRLSPPVGRWQALYGAPLPKLLVLDSPKIGGSHFALHHLQRHPQLLCLHETLLYADVRQYLVTGEFPMYDLIAGQLVPYKSDPERVTHVVMNKPAMDTIYAQYLLHRDRISTLYLVRNPVDYSLSRKASRLAHGPAGGAGLGDHETAIEDHLLRVMQQFVRKSVDFFDAERDLVLTLEYFAANPERSVEIIEQRLGLEHAAAARSLRLERCARCGRPLTVEARPVKARPPESVLVCRACRAVNIGPGGFNLLREIGPGGFGRWAADPRADRILGRAKEFFGPEYMGFFENERYLDPASHTEFACLYADMNARLRSAGLRAA